MNCRLPVCCVLGLGMAIGPARLLAADATQAVVFAWNAATCHPASPSKAVPVQRISGATAACITAPGGEWNTWIRIPPGTLHGSHDYTAILKYEIVTPPTFPGTFYMFARSKSLGEHRDIWQTWLGDARDSGAARLTLRLPAADDWEFDVGCQGAGSEIIDSLQIVEGTGFVYLPAAESAGPLAPPPETPVATGASTITIAPPADHAGPVLTATDFGLVADGPAAPVAQAVSASNSVAVAQAIDACRRQGASRLVFPKGVYRFNADTAIPFTKLSDLVIDGQGSEFIFQKLHPSIAAVTVQDCTRCVITNLCLDWDWSVSPLASLCRVVGSAADGLSCSLVFPDLDAHARQLLIQAPWLKLLPMDPETFRLRAPQGLPAPVAQFSWLTGNVLRVTFKQPVPLTVGETYCVRHQYYEMSAFRIGDCRDLLFDKVTIYSMPGMGWVSRGEMQHWGFRNCRIVRREGSRRPLTTTADGFHVTESLGDLLLENCVFTGMGDDCVNIHDNCFQGVERTGDHTLRLVGNRRWRFKVEAGHTIELFHADYSPLGFQSAIDAVAYKGNDTILTLAATLPALSPQTIVFNQHYRTSNVRIANCRFCDTAGRGILTDAQNLTIENCVFDHVFGQGVQLAIDIVPALWAEGRPTTNVVMRGNRFEALNAAGRVDGAAVCTYTRWPAGATAFPLYRTLLIESNRFVAPLGPALSLQSCRDVVVRDNIIDATGTPSGGSPLAAAFVAAHSADLTLASNRWDIGAAGVKPGVLFDPETTIHVALSGNSVQH